MAALSLLMMVTSNEEIRPWLERDLDDIFQAFPRANLWLVTADDRLLGRHAQVRILSRLA